MTRCQDYEAEIETDDLDADIGDCLVCTASAATLEVVKVAPVELAVGSDEAAGDADE
jgi:hypothetical protein